MATEITRIVIYKDREIVFHDEEITIKNGESHISYPLENIKKVVFKKEKLLWGKFWFHIFLNFLSGGHNFQHKKPLRMLIYLRTRKSPSTISLYRILDTNFDLLKNKLRSSLT